MTVTLGARGNSIIGRRAIKNTQPWDEKDAPAMEEEFSLEDLFGDEM